MNPLFFQFINIMYVFVLFSAPYFALYLFIVYASQVNYLYIVLNIFSINIRLTAAKIAGIIILHLSRVRLWSSRVENSVAHGYKYI